MRRRVASFCAALLFTIYSIICGPTYASDIWTVDGNVDPWADLQELEGGEPDEEFGGYDDGGDDQPWLIYDGDFVVPYASSYTVPLTLSNTTIYFGLSDGAAAFSQKGSYNFSSSGTTSVSLPSSTAYHIGPSPVTLSATGYASYRASSSGMTAYLNIPLPDGAKSIRLDGSLSAGLQIVSAPSTPAISRVSSISVYGLLSSGSQKLLGTINNGTSGTTALFTINSPVEYDVSGYDSIQLRLNIGGLSTKWVTASLYELTSGMTLGVEFYFYTSSFRFVISDDNVQVDLSETNGLLSGLIQWVQGIYNTVVSIPGQLGSIITSIAELPSKLWTLISDGLQSLFIPTEEQMQELSDNYNGLFEEKLGFVYQMFSFVVDTFGGFKNTLSSGKAHEFVFPGIQFEMNGETFVLLPESTVSMDNAFMDVLRPVLGTVVSMVCSLALVSVGFDMVVAVMSGASYIEFLKSKKGESD